MKTYLDYSEVIVTRAANSGAELKTKQIPRGTFAGTIYQLGLVRNGQVVAATLLNRAVARTNLWGSEFTNPVGRVSQNPMTGTAE